MRLKFQKNHHYKTVSCAALAIVLSWCYFSSGEVTRAQADTAYNAWYAKYWNSSNNTFFKTDTRTGRIDFWRYAHDWEVIMDRYDLTRDTMYLRQMKQAWTGFIRTNGMGTNWRQNDFNDDIAWWILAAGRAYLLTKDTTYCNPAKREFDWMWGSEWDNTLGGGIWWKNTTHNEKNACINGPAACGAMYLYWIYGDQGYLDKAKMIYDWERKTLYNANTGVVADHINRDGRVSGGAITYNQGTFIGAAYRLFKATRDSSYLRDAWKAADYVRNNMSNRTTGIINNGGLTGDGAAFLLVFVHHMMYFVIDGKQTKYLEWVNLNADAAWKNRRLSDNILSSRWNTVPPATGVESSSCSGGVAMVTLTVLANLPTSIALQRDIVQPIPALSFPKEFRTYSINGKLMTSTGDRIPAVLLEQTQGGRIIKKVHVR